MREGSESIAAGRRRLGRGIGTVILLVGAVAGAQAAYLRDLPQTITQPDGTILECYASGDEYFHWLHDASGHVIVQDPAGGRFVYAQEVAGEIVPSPYAAGSIDPASVGIEPDLRIPEDAYRERRRAFRAPLDGPGATPHWMPNIGQLNNIVIYIRFSDETEFGEQLTTYDGWFNETAEGANSMTRYFQEASYQQLEITTTFYPPSQTGAVVSYQDSHPRGYYRPYSLLNQQGYNGDQQAQQREFTLLKTAVQAVGPNVPPDLDVDFNGDNYVDNVCFIVRGSPDGWSDLLWPHMWALYIPGYEAYINGKQVYTFNFQLQNTLSSPNVGVGVLSHEMFHSLGSPDLYHYNQASQHLEPVGKWDLMEWNTNPPQHMGAYMKQKYGGWIAALPTITADGVYSLQPLPSSLNNAYKITSPNSATEFFVVEYRLPSSSMFEEGLPGSGLLVYRINPSVSGNSEGPPDEVYVYRPGGTTSVNGTVDNANFSADVGRTQIDDSTDPSSFLTNGSAGGLDLSQIGSAGSTITFQVGEGGPVTCQTTSGDANGDATVNVLDVVVTVNHILATDPLGEGGQACANVNGDGEINVLDLVGIVNIILQGKAPSARSAASDPLPAPVAWSAESGPAGIRLGLEADRLGGLQWSVLLPAGCRLAASPRLSGGRPGSDLAWSEEGGWVTVVAYNLTGGILGEGWIGLDLPLRGEPVDPGTVDLTGLLLASPSGGRLVLQPGPIGDRAPLGLQTILRAVHPNPTLGPTRIAYDLGEGTVVRLAVFDMGGRLVRTVRAGMQAAGRHSYAWDGRDDAGGLLPSGIYLVRLTAAGREQTLKVLLLH